MPLTLMKRSATNKASRSQKKYNHTTGTKSFAQIRDAQVQLQEKQELNKDVSKERSMNDTFSEALNYNRNVTSSQLVKF
ncbi:hypothetical protein G4B88_002459 [Cannabis sativa]|uniref:Uncharacterized protein n=1 Tax=Cannabis sativa TaxID=3483 RepID=A0A7J6I8F5_CANSA|nr:hypothetical protein G4B88_002459 [Cannabis sativa]